jgi:hypothetical protein
MFKMGTANKEKFELKQVPEKQEEGNGKRVKQIRNHLQKT